VTPGDHPSGLSENAENSPTTSTTCKGENADRAFPVELVGGGFRWPGAGRIDAGLRRAIFETEIGARSAHEATP
jgi:hypothetical protein